MFSGTKPAAVVDISVITPVYNNVTWIERCLQNVIDQQCPTVEHIVIDGGSNDGTVAILEEYARRYPHIRFVSEKDRGQSHAMNKGIAMTNGNVISFLNADDSYTSGTLQRAVTLTKDLPEPGILVGDLIIQNLDGSMSLSMPVSFTPVDHLASMLLVGRLIWFPANPSSYFYHKRVHDIVGGYDEENHYTMDMDFLLRAGAVCHIRYVHEIFGVFRKLPDTKTVQSKAEGLARGRSRAVWQNNRHLITRIDRLLAPLWICRFLLRVACNQCRLHCGKTGRLFRQVISSL
jgi:glycosyltransferase involved in cell wall biosynthesis